MFHSTHFPGGSSPRGFRGASRFLDAKSHRAHFALAGVAFETVLEAADGSQALEYLHQQSVQLIMCDINMPVMDGLELLKRMKQQSLAIGVPIVMVTTEPRESQVLQAIASGAKGYIRKPFTPTQIANSVIPLFAS